MCQQYQGKLIPTPPPPPRRLATKESALLPLCARSGFRLVSPGVQCDLMLDGSPKCGSCWKMQYSGGGHAPVYIIVVDSSAVFQLSKLTCLRAWPPGAAESVRPAVARPLRSAMPLLVRRGKHGWYPCCGDRLGLKGPVACGISFKFRKPWNNIRKKICLRIGRALET